jgi:hypothetical protein
LPFCKRNPISDPGRAGFTGKGMKPGERRKGRSVEVSGSTDGLRRLRCAMALAMSKRN